jgi:hypothetical protein
MREIARRSDVRPDFTIDVGLGSAIPARAQRVIGFARESA